MDSVRTERVVVVDDDRLHREIARDALGGRARIECCADAEEAMAALAREPAALVLSDLHMPGASGLDLLDRVRRDHPGTDFILLTGSATVQSAVAALRRGAADYLTKPIEPEELALVVERTLDRRRLLADNERMRDTLATLEACGALDACLDPSEVHSVSLDLALRLLGSERAFVIFHRSGLPQANGLESRGYDDSETARRQRAFASAKPLALDQYAEIDVASTGPVHRVLRDAEIDARAMMLVPLRGEEDETALLCAEPPPAGFDAAALERARMLQGHAEIALRNAERYRKAKERAFVDDVTEVYNARYLLEALERELRRSERYGSELSVIFLDLDRFKLVNDHHGHLVGSQALRQLSRVLMDCVRQVDTVARYGGDEFTILLSDTDEQTGLRIAERIRSTVEATPFEAEGETVLHLTCSVGIANYPSHGRRREQLLDAADKAMYRAKSQGRNRVCSASELDGLTVDAESPPPGTGRDRRRSER